MRPEGWERAVEQINNVLWSEVFVGFCLLTGLYFSVRTGFLQLRLAGTMVALIRESRPSAAGISSFQAFCTALAGRVGTGAISGTAAAIFYGGAGAVFWMWVLAFLGAATTFVESALGQIYKIKLDGEYRGGPAYYIEKYTGKKWYACLFAGTLVLSAGLLQPGVQSNAIAASFYGALGIPQWLSGLVIAVLLGLIIFGGIRRIAVFSEMAVPAMAGAYLLVALVLVLANLDKLGEVLQMIFHGAVGADAAFGGILGSTIMWGVRRGIYSNEAGLGTQPHAAAAAEVSHPAKQGLVQAFGVYIDTWLVCSATAFMLLVTDCFNTVGRSGYLHVGQGSPLMAGYAQEGLVGPEYAQAAVNTLFPGFGGLFVAVCLACFAFTSLLSLYYQAECNLAYLFRGKASAGRTPATLALRLLMVGASWYFCVHSAEGAWAAGDVGVSLTAWLNLLALWYAQRPALLCLRDFEAQRKQGLDPCFRPGRLGIRNAELWDEMAGLRAGPGTTGLRRPAG
ncbi:MAG: alanine/glycine:cation symporter family protein [Bacillota bacterium]|nr:alanine/glycine:cation symporter family protein [Bacillota bacterium]